MRGLDRDLVVKALRAGGGCLRETARTIGVARSTLMRYVAREIPPSAYIYGARISEAHGALLAASAVSPEVAAARGYRTDPKRGLIVPLWRANGEPAWSQVRRHEPDQCTRAHRRWRQNRYANPRGASRIVDVSPYGRSRVLDRTTRLYVTESPRKADGAVSARLACVAVAGVRLLVLDAEAWNEIGVADREVYIAFDADAVTNREVAAAEEQLAARLLELGARVHIVRLPAVHGRYKAGLDDYLAAGHTEQDLLGLARAVS